MFLWTHLKTACLCGNVGKKLNPVIFLDAVNMTKYQSSFAHKQCHSHHV